MKQFFYTLLIFGLIYFCYWYITKAPDIVSVTGRLTTLEEKTTGGFYNASVQGTAENTGDIVAKDIWIIYKIGDKEVNAYISELPPKQSMKFRTGICKTKIKDPVVKLVDVRYNE